jgi:hypothetical protein
MLNNDWEEQLKKIMGGGGKASPHTIWLHDI